MAIFPRSPLGLEFSATDHVARAEFFLANARETNDITIVNWLLLAGVNSARAPIEIALTEWDAIYKKGDSAPFLAEAELRVRHFKLIATLRVHDFHRQAIHLRPNAQMLLGPIKMKTGAQTNSLVGLSLDPITGLLNETKIHNASISYDRPIQARGFELFDNASQAFVLLPDALGEYLADLKPFLHSHFPRIVWP